jgi:hypothetical protein
VLLAAYLLAAPSDLIDTQKGELPIIITAPHGGKMEVPDVPARTGVSLSGKVVKFTTVRDVNTDILARDIAKDLEADLHEEPYFVIARFSRKYIDANRPPDEAYESPAAKSTYDTYHADIAKDQLAILDRYHSGLLVDVHGQGRFADAVVRGTNNLATVDHWIKAYGKDSLLGPAGLFGQLSSAGMKIVPPFGSEDKEYAALDGGYTVQTYGSRKGGNFDAVQLEFGGDFRKKAALANAARVVAKALEAQIARNRGDGKE